MYRLVQDTLFLADKSLDSEGTGNQVSTTTCTGSWSFAGRQRPATGPATLKQPQVVVVLGSHAGCRRGRPLPIDGNHNVEGDSHGFLERAELQAQIADRNWVRPIHAVESPCGEDGGSAHENAHRQHRVRFRTQPRAYFRPPVAQMAKLLDTVIAIGPGDRDVA